MESTYEKYIDALDGVGPRVKELILGRAEPDAGLTFEEFLRLCKRAYPDDE